MLKPERYAQIVQIVNDRGYATVEDLSEALKVSKATIRRDFLKLEEDHAILRTHGGAMKCSHFLTTEVPTYLRINMQKEEKEHLGITASQMVAEGSTIFISAGTTGQMLATQLHQFRHLMVVTNDIEIAREISNTDNDLVVIGGHLKSSSSTLYGFFAEQMLQQLHFDLVFLSADAVDKQGYFMDFNADEIGIKRLAMASGAKSIMMCDTRKFNLPAFVNICPFSAVFAVITNENIAPENLTLLKEHGVNVILAPSAAPAATEQKHSHKSSKQHN